ncbi:MAG: phosphoglycerate kinase [Rickettsiales bacterium]
MSYATLDTVNVTGKTVLLRVDLNVPMHAGRVTDSTRLERVLPTIKLLADKNAKVVLLTHFGRPKGQFVPSMSVAPLVDALQHVLPGINVKYGTDCVGPLAVSAIKALEPGQVVLLENLRFHGEEEKGDDSFAKEMASLGDIYVNDAFSCSHRAHASITGIPKYLPTYVGLAMQEEIFMLDSIFSDPERPLAAIVGGSKVSTKLELLENLLSKVDKLIIGGAMANTFLYAQGHSLGVSLYEADLKETALTILKKAKEAKCDILLPDDLVVATALDKQAPCKVVSVNAVPKNTMALDIGPQSMMKLAREIATCKTLVWNGPVGAFETTPFDGTTVQLARIVAQQTAAGTLKSVAGGGDTVAALAHAGLREEFTYLSTAGGAFLEWLEGKELPGVQALRAA